MSRLLIIGAGGHGKVVADAARSHGAWEELGFIDDRMRDERVLDVPIVGTTAELSQFVGRYASIAVAIGSAQQRLRLLDQCRSLGFSLPVIAHKTAVVSRFATLAHGCVILALAAVSADARLGVGCIVNAGATVDHDCQLADGVHVCPGVHLAGNVTVGARTWIGIGSCVRQELTIGSDVTIGAGSAVVSNIQSGVTVFGVPARPRSER